MKSIKSKKGAKATWQHIEVKNENDRFILNEHRKNRIKLVEKIIHEINQSAFIIDPKQDELYKRYFCEMALSSAFLVLMEALEKLESKSLDDLAYMLTMLIIKSFKGYSTLCKQSFKDNEVLEKFCNNIIKNKDELYQSIEQEFTDNDIQ